MNNKTNTYKHWKLVKDDDDILWCHLDVQGASANVLSAEVLDEFGAIVTDLENDPPHGVVILSDKQNGFIAGADVSEFTQIQNREQALAIISKVHDCFNRFEALTCPTLCLINGYCLGGGMELALACRYRVALDDPAVAAQLPVGATGEAAIYTDSVKLTHVIRRIMIRMTAWINYVNPF